MRHRLIHGYAEVRLEMVWLVVQEHLEPLIAVLVPLVTDEDASDREPRPGSPPLVP
jgi:uncharacterized protein with HEPN domain